MFSSFFGQYRQYKAFRDFDWVQKQTKKYFEMPVQQVKAEYEEITNMAKHAQQIGQYVQEIYKGHEIIQTEKNKAISQGVKSLTSIQKSRTALDTLTQQLLEAAKR